MSYKEYAMGMSFRLNPKNIRKDTFLVPFEGLSREQEMYDTYIAPLDSSSEELVAGYKDGGLIVERENFATKGMTKHLGEGLFELTNKDGSKSYYGRVYRGKEIKTKQSGNLEQVKKDLNELKKIPKEKSIAEQQTPIEEKLKDPKFKKAVKDLKADIAKDKKIGFINRKRLIDKHITGKGFTNIKSGQLKFLNDIISDAVTELEEIKNPNLMNALDDYLKIASKRDFVRGEVEALSKKHNLPNSGALYRALRKIDAVRPQPIKFKTKDEKIEFFRNKRKEAQKMYSNYEYEKTRGKNRIIGDNEVNLAHMDDLYSRHVTGETIGYAPAKVNQELLKGFDQRLREINNQIDNLLENKPEGWEDKLEKLNSEGIELADKSQGFKSFQIQYPDGTSYQYGVDPAKAIDPGNLTGGKKLSEYTESDKKLINLNKASVKNLQKQNADQSIQLLTDIIANDKRIQAAAYRADLKCRKDGGGQADAACLVDDLKKKINSTDPREIKKAQGFLRTAGSILSKGGRFALGALIGTTRPEVAAALTIDAMFPGSVLLKGGTLKEAAGASFFNQIANLFGVGIDEAKTKVEELVSAGKDIGLDDQEIKRLSSLLNQFDNQVKLQDATTEYQRFLNAEKERGPEYIDPFFASEFQNAEKNYNDAIKDFEAYDQEQALSDFEILKKALAKKSGLRAERLFTGPQETIQDTGGLPPKLTTEPLSKFEKSLIEEVGKTIPQGRGEVYEEGKGVIEIPQLSDVALQDITGKTLQELQEQQAQYIQEQEAMTELDEGLLSMMNQAVEEGRQGFKKGGMVQRQGFADGPKMGRRGFLGLLAGIGAYLTTALTSKPTTKIGKEILKQAPKVQGTPEWFPLLTDIIAKKGKDISAKAATEDGMIVKQIKIDGDEVNGVFYRDGKIEVDVNSADGAFEQPYTLMYDPPTQAYEEGTGFIEIPGNFSVVEESPRSYWSGDPKNPDVDYDFDVEDVNFGQHISDTTKLEKFATGKPERLIRNKSGQTPGSNNPDPVETLIEKYGEYDGPYED